MSAAESTAPSSGPLVRVEGVSKHFPVRGSLFRKRVAQGGR